MSGAALCPALLISAPASGQGKTTVTAALARRYRRRGLNVRVFKTGPDFLDPMILEQACGHPVYQLDLWMGGEVHCRALLHQAACEADLILIEGVMGLFDGDCSSADLAAVFGIPVLAVIDGSGMAQTFGALAFGLANFRPGLPFAGAFANRIGSEGHAAMLAESLPAGIINFGWMVRSTAAALPERHLGLVQAAEMDDLHARIDSAADALRGLPESLPPAIAFHRSEMHPLPRLLDGVRIAIARDEALGFVYHANLDLLRAMGAHLDFFSPLRDAGLPKTDAVYLPGGYPELHLDALSANHAMHEALREHHAEGRPIVAECGGMLYLLDTLTDAAGRSATMVGLLTGHAFMQPRLVNLGMQRIPFTEGELRGHTFHYSRLETSLNPEGESVALRHHGKPEAIFRQDRLTASYLHAYFPSNPEAAARLFLP